MALADLTLFLREWLRNPLSVAAIKPSGRSLAALITRDISSRSGMVLELGPGTGVFTQALLEQGVREENLTLVEYSSEFARHLKRRFPGARTLEFDAEKLAENRLYAGAPAGAVVCGLGLLNMSRDKVARIIRGGFSYLRPDGEFFLFTYGARCPVPQGVLAELGLDAQRVGRTYRNIPPAAVYRIRRRD